MTMTGSAATSVVYEPDGLQTRFPVPFPVFDVDDVRAIAVEGAEQTELANFVVEGLGSEEGVHVRFFSPPSFGPKVVLYRWTKRVQESEYPEGGRFPAKVVETDFDRLVAMAQEVDDQLAWTLHIPRGADMTPEEYTGSIFTAADASRAAAAEAAAAAAASGAAAHSVRDMAQSAMDEAGKAALMAESAARSALEAATLVNQGATDASETTKGIVRLATEAEHANGASGLAATPAHVKAQCDRLRVETNEGIEAIKAVARVPVGDMALKPFRPEDLATSCPGWYFMNGDRYPLTSPVGTALASLPENFKTDWGVTEDGETINVPNMFYTDGRGYFLRAVDGTERKPGSREDDAIRNITGTHEGTDGGGISGAFTTTYAGGNRPNQPGYSYIILFDASRVVPTAPENRPLNIGMTPAIFLGV